MQVAGEEFEFDILVKDVFDNLCNHRSDVVRDTTPVCGRDASVV